MRHFKQSPKQQLESDFGCTGTANIKPTHRSWWNPTLATHLYSLTSSAEHKLLFFWFVTMQPFNYPELAGVLPLFPHFRFVASEKLESWDFLQISLACHLQGELKQRLHLSCILYGSTRRTCILFYRSVRVHTIVYDPPSDSPRCAEGKADKRFDICVTVPFIGKWAHNEHNLEAGSSACLEIVNIKLASFCKNEARFMYSSHEILIKCVPCAQSGTQTCLSLSWQGCSPSLLIRPPPAAFVLCPSYTSLFFSSPAFLRCSYLSQYHKESSSRSQVFWKEGHQKRSRWPWFSSWKGNNFMRLSIVA